MESPERWQFDHFDEDMRQGMATVIAAEDTVILGRRTYEEWARFWPTSSMEPYASHINRTPKYVVSTMLDEVYWGEWGNVTLIRENVSEEINRLKRQPGRNIGVAGSPTLVRSLVRDDLLDTLILMVHPVIAGVGKTLFAAGDSLKRFKLVDSATTRTGVVILTYAPRLE